MFYVLSWFLVNFVQIFFLDSVVKMSTSHDEGLDSVRNLFADSESDVSIEEIEDDVTSGVDSPACV